MGTTSAHKVGLLFSTTGPYAALGRSALDGARMAVDEVNAEGEVALVPVMCDPEGIPHLYEKCTRRLLREGAVRHIVGGITSWSRKDMIPVLERRDAMLWYPCPYEGFECNDHVVYLGACPNQHLVPLVDHVLQDRPRRAVLVGSNYVWGWETLRVARERLSAAGVEIAAERFVPLGETGCAHLIDEIRACRPDVIVNSLIGPSNHAFMHMLAEIRDMTGSCQVISANQTEADLDELGQAADGMLSIAAWFEGIETPENRLFRARIADALGPDYRASCNFATAYTAVRLLAEGIARVGHDEPQAVFDAVSGRILDTVLGPVEIDPATRHTTLVPRMGRLRRGVFEIVSAASDKVAPDPYLTRVTPPPPRQRKPELRIVS
ncbi:amino acid/amide ABC transporter substrate-binding protein (HAAT family) [Rhodovulum bhavnagarense]|uniref:Amino acid/amide ABC transporter substrate-binding protein (HAAT family) n=1 Tax=Rhodovulum bhavnagarense TaxID=992286 RepID=A0A4R2RN92_9RHOB|nr:transporter substrate-binding protein [Rhodovulum bhavnagarense]TCP60665.1 amino acid/amide ABC transporter substrate-binding protein (HAAT family) [Rhodovulum bhavnagarense]